MSEDLWALVGLLLLGAILIAMITPSASELAAMQTRVLPYPQEAIFEGALEYLQGAGYPIRNVERESGFISTGYASQEQLLGSFVGILERAFIGERRFSVTITIVPVSERACRVTATLVAEEWVQMGLAGGYWRRDPRYFDRDDYDKFFRELTDAIRKYAS